MTEIDQSAPPAPAPAPAPAAPPDPTPDAPAAPSAADAYWAAQAAPPTPAAPPDQAPASGGDAADAYWGQVASARKAILASSLVQGQDTPPERQAKVVALADRLQLPPEVVNANYDELTRRDALQGIDNQKLLQDHPNLAHWLIQPGNAGLSQGDLPQLQHLDAMAKGLDGTYNPGGILPPGFMFSDTGDGTIRGPLHEDGSPPVLYKGLDDLRSQLTSQSLADQQRAEQYRLHLEAASEVGGLSPAMEAGVQGSIGSTAAAVLSATNWWSRVFGGEGNATLGGLTAAELREFAGEGVTASELADSSLSGGMQRTAGSLLADAPLYMAGGGLVRMAEAGPRLIDLTEKMKALSGLAQVPTSGIRDLMPLMRALRATSPLPVVPNSSYMASVWKNAIAFSPLAARSGINSGAEHGPAYGSADFLIQALGPALAGHLGLSTATEGAETAAAAGGMPAVLGSFVGHATAQGGAMAATEFASALHEAATGVDPDALRSDRLIPRLAQAGAMGGLLTAAFQLPGATGELTMRRQMASSAAMREGDALGSLVESFRASAAMGRSEEHGRALLDQIIPPAARVKYLQADDLGEVAKKVGMTPEELAGALNAGDEYKAALATGKTMHVQTQDLVVAASKLKDPEKITALLSYARARPNGANVTAALQFYKDSPQEIAGLHATLQGDVATASKSVQESDPIYRDMMGQVEEAGRPTQEARDDARLMAARFNVLAMRWNEGAEARGARKLDPLEEYQKFKLQVQKSQPGAKIQDITDALLDRIRSGKRPSESQAYGKSLDEFLRQRGIKDTGGDLASLGVDADLKPGQKAMIDPGGHGLDIAAQRAHEEWYLEDEDPNTLLAKIQEGTAGRPVYSDANRDPNHAPVHELLADIERSMSEHGAHIGMSNAAIKAKLAGSEGPALNRFEQAAFHGTGNEKPYPGFDDEKIGGPGGEGTQNEGHGHYVSESKMAGNYYRKQNSRMALNSATMGGKSAKVAVHDAWKASGVGNYVAVLPHVAESLDINDFHVDDAIADQKEGIENLTEVLRGPYRRDRDILEHNLKTRQDALKVLEHLRGLKVERSEGRLYHVEIPDAGYLKFHESVKGQDPDVLQKLKDAGILTTTEGSGRDYEIHGDKGALPIPRADEYTGAELYHALVDVSGGSKAASERLSKAGIVGNEYRGDADGLGENAGYLNHVIFKGKDIAIRRYEQGGENDARASIEFNAERHFLMTLNSGANLSSVLHESAHFWFETMGDYAVDPQAPPQLRADYEKLLEFSGYGTHENKLAMQNEQGALAEKLRIEDRAPTADESRRMAELAAPHEKVARGMEQYLMEGHAPSPELRGTFQRFRLWLTDIYRQIKSLVTLTPEVKGVFDRMLATDDAIAAAQKDMGYSAHFKDEAAFGLGPEKWQAYLRSITDARAAADVRVFSQAMRVLRAEQTKTYRREEDGVRRQAMPIIAQRPQYVAENALVHGLDAHGNPLERPVKLDRAELEREYGTGVRSKLLRGITAEEGGIPLQTAAEMLGFHYGADLYEAMLRANFVPRKQAVDHLTRQMMEGLHPEMSADALHEQAMQAVHANNAQADVMARESAALGLKANRTPIAREQLKSMAEGLIAAENHRDVNHDSYVRAERQFSNAVADELAKPNPDYTKAFLLNQRAELAHASYRAAQEAEEVIANTVALVRKAMKTETRQMIGRAGGYVVTGPAGERLVTMDQATAQATAADLKGTTENLLQAMDRLTDLWKDRPTRFDLTMGAVQDFYHEAAQIMHMAKEAHTVLIDGKKEQLAETVADLTDSQRIAAKGGVVPVPRTKGNSYLFRQWLRQFDAGNRTLAAICRSLDGEQSGGKHWNDIVRPLNDAANNETVRKLANMAETKAAFDAWGKRGQKGSVFVPEVGEHMDLETRIGVALYAGTKEGMERMTTGDQWSPEQVTAIVGTLDKADLQLVKTIWANLEKKWPEISATKQRLSGIPPERATPVPVKTAFGTIDGGYYPIKYDGDVGARAFELSLDTPKDPLSGKPKSGFTVSRAETTGMRLQYGFDALFRHNDDTAHYLSHADATDSLNKILNARGFQQSTIDRFGVVTYQALLERIKNVLDGPRGPQNALERGLRFVRTRTGLAAMGYNLMTFVSHGFGVPQSMARVGSAQYMAAEGQLLSNAGDALKGYAFIKAKSSMMANMRSIMTPESAERIRQGAAGNALATIHDHALDLIHYALGHINSATWMAEYKTRMAEDATDEPRAIALADQAVRDTQGTGQTVDKTLFQDKNEYVKVLSQYLSFFTRTYQMLRPSVAGMADGGYKTPQAYANMAKAFAMLVILPATTEALFRQAVRPSADNDNSPEFWLKKLSAANAEYALSSVFLGRELAGAFEGHGAQDPATMRSMTSLAGTAKGFAHFLTDDSHSGGGKVLRSALDLTGTYFGLPVGQADRVVQGILYDVDQGTADPRAPLFGPPPQR